MSRQFMGHRGFRAFLSYSDFIYPGDECATIGMFEFAFSVLSTIWFDIWLNFLDKCESVDDLSFCVSLFHLIIGIIVSKSNNLCDE